ncbi:MAG TPA: SIMPL domain-containing protein [Candidatus Nitrosotenuis sp.]|nr:SIMPL domain-containing protein [Candidatus Nitrosotenuis sp.]
MNKTVTLATATGLVLALAFLLGAVPAGMDAQAQTTEPTPFPSREKTLSVTGTATTSVDPDLVNIQFGVEVQKETAKDAFDANTKQMNAIVDAIKAVGITDDEISTAQLTIYPVYESYQDKVTGVYKQRLTGYSVSNIIRVETAKMSLASDIIDGAVAAGANRVDSVYFTLSPKRQMQVSDDLLAEAIKNAQSKAEKALAPLNYQVIGVKHVSLSEFGYPPPIPLPYYKAAYDGAVSESASRTPIFSSEQDVSTTASVIFIIGSR